MDARRAEVFGQLRKSKQARFRAKVVGKKRITAAWGKMAAVIPVDYRYTVTERRTGHRPMPFDPTLAAIRFGTGLSATLPPPDDAAGMLARLTGPDAAALAYPIPGFETAQPRLADFRQLMKDRREARGTDREAGLQELYQVMRMQARDARLRFFQATLARGVTTADGLRERLVLFWADHFTVRSRDNFSAYLVAPFAADAIRPHINGTFNAMLRAVITHPMMLIYLDQIRSIGPTSRPGQRRNLGLNENLAREMLELHTVGVDGPYDQTDVRELAELLTGLVWTPESGFEYDPRFAEPGSETVLGVTYDQTASLDTVFAALDGIAAHPATARHIAHKLAVHFVADAPDAALVQDLTDVFTQTGGDLLAVTTALLNHPAAWVPQLQKVKPPFGYLTAALRALGVPGAGLTSLTLRQTETLFGAPLSVMGQPWEEPPGPDGWPEEGAAWVTPQAMAGRIDWAMTMPAQLVDPLPDPRDFVRTALGPNPPDPVVFAASAAENVAVGIGLILSSAAFQRR